MKVAMRLTLVLIPALFASVQAVGQANRSQHSLTNLLHRRQQVVSMRLTPSAPDAVAIGLANAKVYRFATADYPGADGSIAWDFNTTTGVIVGQFFFSSTSDSLAFTLSGGNYRILTPPGSTAAAATAINSSGQIAGAYADSAGNVHGFVDTAGTFTAVDFPGSLGSVGTAVYDINDGGVMVGGYEDASNVTHGFVDNAGVFTTIDPPGSTSTLATAINTAGDVVGLWTDAANKTHGFLLSGGIYTQLDFPLSTSTNAFGINDSGEISGTYEDAASVNHGFIFSSGTWTRVDVAGATDTEIAHIKNTGAITGEYTDDKIEEHGIRGH